MGHLILIFGGLTLFNIFVGYTVSEQYPEYQGEVDVIPFVEVENDVKTKQPIES